MNYGLFIFLLLCCDNGIAFTATAIPSTPSAPPPVSPAPPTSSASAKSAAPANNDQEIIKKMFAKTYEDFNEETPAAPFTIPSSPEQQ